MRAPRATAATSPSTYGSSGCGGRARALCIFIRGISLQRRRRPHCALPQPPTGPCFASPAPPRPQCWNDNSPDTNGGIVKSNWADIDWAKVNFLRRIGLKPWYA